MKKKWLFKRHNNKKKPALLSEPVPQALSSPSTIHLECSTLPLSHFIEIILNGDLSRLVITGSPSQEELIAAWEVILEQYSDMIKTDKSESIFKLYQKIYHTQWQIVFIDNCIYALKLHYDEEIAELLSQRGFGIVQHPEDWEAYLKSLYAIETGAKVLVVLYNQYNAEYKLRDKNQGAPEYTSVEERRLRYEKEIAMLSKYQGQRINKEKVTVLEYAAIVNNFLDEQRMQKKEVSNGR